MRFWRGCCRLRVLLDWVEVLNLRRFEHRMRGRGCRHRHWTFTLRTTRVARDHRPTQHECGGTRASRNRPRLTRTCKSADDVEPALARRGRLVDGRLALLGLGARRARPQRDRGRGDGARRGHGGLAHGAAAVGGRAPPASAGRLRAAAPSRPRVRARERGGRDGDRLARGHAAAGGDERRRAATDRCGSVGRRGVRWALEGGGRHGADARRGGEGREHAARVARVGARVRAGRRTVGVGAGRGARDGGQDGARRSDDGGLERRRRRGRGTRPPASARGPRVRRVDAPRLRAQELALERGAVPDPLRAQPAGSLRWLGPTDRN